MYPPYETATAPGLHRDFSSEYGWGTLSEVLMPYDENQTTDRIAAFVVTFVSYDPPETIQIETLPSPFDIEVLLDDELSKTIIEQGILKRRSLY